MLVDHCLVRGDIVHVLAGAAAGVVHVHVPPAHSTHVRTDVGGLPRAVTTSGYAGWFQRVVTARGCLARGTERVGFKSSLPCIDTLLCTPPREASCTAWPGRQAGLQGPTLLARGRRSPRLQGAHVVFGSLLGLAAREGGRPLGHPADPGVHDCFRTRDEAGRRVGAHLSTMAAKRFADKTIFTPSVLGYRLTWPFGVV